MKTFILLITLLVSDFVHGSCSEALKLLGQASQEQFFSEAPVRIIGPIETDSRHATEVYTAMVGDNTLAVFKPDLAHMRASNSSHEVAAYLLSKELELDFVPVTTQRVIDGRVGSLQQMITNSVTATKIHGSFFYADYQSFLRTKKLNFFDYLTINIDRHSENFIFDEWGNLWAIDHGATFMLYSGDFKKIGRLFGNQMENIKASDEIGQRLVKLDEEKLRILLSRHLTERELEMLISRRKYYLEYFHSLN